MVEDKFTYDRVRSKWQYVNQKRKFSNVLDLYIRFVHKFVLRFVFKIVNIIEITSKNYEN